MMMTTSDTYMQARPPPLKVILARLRINCNKNIDLKRNSQVRIYTRDPCVRHNRWQRGQPTFGLELQDIVSPQFPVEIGRPNCHDDGSSCRDWYFAHSGSIDTMDWFGERHYNVLLSSAKVSSLEHLIDYLRVLTHGIDS